jgi:regulator of replication initiation timing
MEFKNRILKIDYDAKNLYQDDLNQLYTELNGLFEEYIKEYEVYNDLRCPGYIHHLDIKIHYFIYQAATMNDIKIEATYYNKILDHIIRFKPYTEDFDGALKEHDAVTELYEDMTHIYNRFITSHFNDDEKCSSIQNLDICADTGRRYMSNDDMSKDIRTPAPSFEMTATFSVPSDTTKTFHLRVIVPRKI